MLALPAALVFLPTVFEILRNLWRRKQAPVSEALNGGARPGSLFEVH